MNFFIIITMLFLSSSLPRTALTFGMETDSTVFIPISETDNEFDPSVPFNTSVSINPSGSCIQTPNLNDTAEELGLALDGPESDGAFFPRGAIPPWVTCETSGASPLVKDVIGLADYMFNDKHVWSCTQTTSFGSRCTRIQWFKGAAAGLCGMGTKTLNCQRVSKSVRYLAENCARNGRVGGKFKYNSIDVTLIVYAA
ncbi:uncharacterized protein LAJ45_02296 [Morchella importuna]|uniref:uncharacterized protein n=1 Tax=Morchella importuna TaxID=1174673 RepID=UPI001E8D4002|nr:uncharacterized protein LAJ45_02296 [Morchella importuna]KAH8153483.1 hypothetical protein LAJ45_02296 [Morchella importuna]